MWKVSDEHKSMILVVMFFLFLLNVVYDGMMTDKALDMGGYYETNTFTNHTSPYFHAIVLILISITVLTICLKKNYLTTFGITFFTVLNLVWTANNIMSTILLGV